MDEKILKDPVYGYISIPKDLLNNIIDTDCFQRLRHIRQTSYAPLYSAALHNRFIHSIGVYFLGRIAFGSLKESVRTNFTQNFDEVAWEDLEQIFLLSCLLHDVGHAPFSHTGEKFFLNRGGSHEEKIFLDLVDAVNEKDFQKDVSYYHETKEKPAAPHEIMSVIVALKVFPQYFENDNNRSFFSRCITGYQHRSDNNFRLAIENILISLLNSSVIDVDRLDYLIRDAFVTGYDSISIDYKRLLKSVSVRKIESKYKLVFDKKALSVLENVIYAHDSERKWIQNHPIVLYEHFLIQYSIRCVNKHFKNNNLFCLESLLITGKNFGENKILLLCDDDIIYYIKNVCSDELTKEYFSRNSRRRPVWKSEAEYRTLFERQLGEERLEKLESQIDRLEKFLREELRIPVINDTAIDECIATIKRIEENENLVISKVDKEDQLQSYKSILKLLKCLKDFSTENMLEFDYAIVKADQFKSGFQKEELSNTIIYFSNLKKENKLGDVVNLLKGTYKHDKFFYLYYKRTDKEINASKLASAIGESVNREI